MKLSEFKFELPSSLIAANPLPNRDDSRLMVLNRKDGSIEHRQFRDILNYFTEGDVMVFNNTRVFPARMYGNKEKTGAKIEVFLLRELNKQMRLWDVLVDPARKIRVGNKLYFGENDALVAEVIDNTTSRGRTIRFLFDGTDEEMREVLDSLGETPIPKLLGRDVLPEDRDRFQTIYAQHVGAVAAPSAGLHFSRELMKRLEIVGVNFAEVTLHIGLGAFRSVEVEDLTKHKSESENFEVNDVACKVVNAGIDERKRICAVGTTSMRAIESAVSATGHMKPVSGWTDKFIFPPYEFQIANSMITNFHLPESTLVMMAAAFAGYDFLMHAYREAMKEKYRFFTYGDAMLIL
ncbi:MAG: tRNA preQ1(34) S-adenosylmethionine ribosyltransferase-isomerase QueA [Bacteroidia bacterium]